MILDELVLHDFGVYAGRQKIALTPPSPEKPVILFYGLNGCGKTTILEALQIALFGQHAPFLQGRDYGQYITERINRHAIHGQASLRLDFHRSENGQMVHYRIYRVWKRGLSAPKETLEVIKNGHKSTTLSKNWSQYVEEIMSSRLAHFFFFDGEKIEEYASEDGARQLIATGLNNLLGLNLIDRSIKDMTVLKRKKIDKSLENTADDGLKEEIKEKEEALRLLGDYKEKLLIDKARIQTHEIDVYQRKLDGLTEQYRSLGGNIWERRDEIRQTIADEKARKIHNGGLVRDAISGALPLSLVQHFFSDIEQLKHEIESLDASNTRHAIIEARDNDILGQMKNAGTEAKIIKDIASYMKNSRKALLKNKKSDAPFTNTRELEGFDAEILENEINAALETFEHCLKEGEEIDQRIGDLTLEEEAIPSTEDIQKLTTERLEVEASLEKSKARMEDIDQDIEKLKAEMQRVEARLDTLHRQLLDASIESKREQHYIRRIDKANATLQAFAKKVLDSKIKDIEQHILECYSLLLRKDNLFDTVSIDTDTLEIALGKDDGNTISSGQLSAGERQLLVISILWGVARASSKPFPVAIDTPFGRLDSTHRKNMVSEYFTSASHQIMVFSTDEEIVGQYFDAIKPSTGKVYRLEHDNKHGKTSVQMDTSVQVDTGAEVDDVVS